MPGVSLEDPFLLSEFTTPPVSGSQTSGLVVSCTPAQGTPAHLSYDRNSSDVESELLVVTVQGEGIQLFNTSDQKCILSYSAPPGYSFVGSAKSSIKSTNQRQVYAVISKGSDIVAKEEGKTVWMWKEELLNSTAAGSTDAMEIDDENQAPVTSAARKTVKKFDREIQQLHVSPVLSNHIILTNTDGTVSLVTDDLKRVVVTKEAKESSRLIWSTVHTSTRSWIPPTVLPGGLAVIVSVLESNSTLSVSISFVDQEHRKIEAFDEVILENVTTGARGFAFDVTSGQFSFLTSEGDLKVFNVSAVQGSKKAHVSQSLSLPLTGFLLETSENTPSPSKPAKKGRKAAAVSAPAKTNNVNDFKVDTVALGDNYLAVAGIRKNAQEQHEQILTIWDVRYGTLQAKHILPSEQNLQEMTCQLSLVPKSHLVLTLSAPHDAIVKTNVYLVPYYCEPMSLLGAMGKMKDTTPFLNIAKESSSLLVAPSNSISGVVNVSDLIEGSGVQKDFQKRLEAAQSSETKVLKNLLSDSTTGSIEAFENVFFKHLEDLTQHATKQRLERFGVTAEEVQSTKELHEERKKENAAKAAAAAAASKDDHHMDIDVKEPEAEVKSKDNKKEKKSKKSKKAEKTAEAGSSSESSSDDEEEEPVIVLSSDDDDEEDDDLDHAVDEAEEQARLEAYLKSVSDWRITEAEAVKNYKIQRRHLRAGRKQEALPELSHHFVTSILARCFARLPNGNPDMSFWPSKVILYLIQHQLVGNANTGAGKAGIALDLMDREEWSLLEVALVRLYDIPELDLIMILKQVVGLNKSTIDESATPTKTPVHNAIPTVPHMLSLLISAPRNEIFMQQALKRLSVSELEVVLKTLEGWIQVWDERGGVGHLNQSPDKKRLADGVPGYPLMIDFMNLLLDVHFPALILSPHLHPVLKSLQTLIGQEAHVADQLEQSLRGPLGLFYRKQMDYLQRQKEIASGGRLGGQGSKNGAGFGSLSASSAAQDKRRRRKFEGGEGLLDYAVEIIHM